MSRDYELEDMAVIALLLSTQQTCEPITISIGYSQTDGRINKGIVIKKAPMIVIEKLMEDGCICEWMGDGMLVRRG